jgi:hypothetical protein
VEEPVVVTIATPPSTLVTPPAPQNGSPKWPFMKLLPYLSERACFGLNLNFGTTTR